MLKSIKKALSLVIVFMMLLSMCAMPSFSATNQQILGDVNGDGMVNISDATAVQCYIAKILACTDDQVYLANVDGNEGVNIKDATYIQMYIAKLISEKATNADGYAIEDVIQIVNPTDDTTPTSTETEPTSTETEPTSTETEPTSTETEPISTETQEPTTEPTDETTEPTTETQEPTTEEPTQPVTGEVTFTLYYVPTAEDIADGCNFRANVKYATGDYVQYKFEATKDTFNGDAVYKVEITRAVSPAGYEIEKVQYQVYSAENQWVSQIVVDYNNTLYDLDGTVLVATSSELSEYIPDQIIPTETQESTTEPTTETEEPTTEPTTEEPTTDAPAVSYSLIGYIDGADLGCEGDNLNPGILFDSSNQLYYTFSQDSYVFVKKSDNSEWYMFDEYTTTSTGVLKSTTQGSFEKMLIPAGFYVIDLYENTDGTLTLTYAPVMPTVDTSETTQGTTEGEATYTLYYVPTAEDIADGCNFRANVKYATGDYIQYKFVATKDTFNGDAVYKVEISRAVSPAGYEIEKVQYQVYSAENQWVSQIVVDDKNTLYELDGIVLVATSSELSEYIPDQIIPTETQESTTEATTETEAPTIETQEPTTDTQEPTTDTPKVGYSLVGYIDGADLGCEGDNLNPGILFDSSNQLYYTFSQDSYVFVKKSDNSEWYMFDEYTTTSTGVLKNTTQGSFEKMLIPAGFYVIDLYENIDGTLTLTYAPAMPTVDTSETTEATTETEAPTTEPTTETEEPTTEPSPDYTIYFDADHWDTASATFSAYVWDDNGSKWVSLTDEDGDGIYSGDLGAEYTNIIFCRMNPSGKQNDWSGVWNQTSDLTKPSDKNCFKIEANGWSGANGTWSTI